ncbi:MAG: thiamine pyrophosphate-binding protein [Chloroflexi bacterium]|nr:thiamine pyrophosphate-binding protein [Chloroflexota bacterium]
MNGSQVVLRSLMAQRVDTLFGIIATHTIHLYDALYDLQDHFRHITGRQELALGFMADGYARASGRPGVLLTSVGPGAANSMHSMGEAFHSSSSILQVTTNVERGFINSRRGARHEPRDQLGMFASVTGWNALAESVESVPECIDEAFVRFKTRRPRPVELELPGDLLAQEGDVEIGPPSAAEPPAGDPAAVQRAVELLRRARRPVLLAGDGVVHGEGTGLLLELAERLGAPVGLLDGGKGAFPDDHPLAVGFVMGGRSWGTNTVWDLLERCDLSLVVGSNILYRDTLAHGLKLPSPLIHVDLDEECFNKNYPAEVTIRGAAGPVLRQMLDVLGSRDVHKGEAYARDVRQARERTLSSLQAQWPNGLRLMQALREVLPRESILAFDATTALLRANRCLPIYEPRSYLAPWGWAGLGFGLPAALGAKLACPDRPVVCISGDGGFQYNMQELGTAVQHGINIVLVIMNDNAWGTLKQRQATWLGGRFIATDLVNPDFVRLGEAYGIESTRVSTVDGLARALGRALAVGRLQLIEVQIPNGIDELR